MNLRTFVLVRGWSMSSTVRYSSHSCANKFSLVAMPTTGRGGVSLEEPKVLRLALGANAAKQRPTEAALRN
jgi:hypothetical protein